MSFSERMGLVPERQIQVRSMDERLRNRLYNFYNILIDYNGDSVKLKSARMYILDKLGMLLGNNFNDNDKAIRQKFLIDGEWYVPYDIIEYALEWNGKYKKDSTGYEDLSHTISRLNGILSEEKSGYRFFEGKFVPITNETELEEIKTAMHSEFEAVDTHISKALALYSDRDNYDYENSIKESISAVEAMCCIITGKKDRDATLGVAIRELKNHGVHIHDAMEEAFIKLYKYTNNEGGIRHGGIDFKKTPEEDARYMLVSCSAFVNYLKDKYSNSKSAE